MAKVVGVPPVDRVPDLPDPAQKQRFIPERRALSAAGESVWRHRTDLFCAH